MHPVAAVSDAIIRTHPNRRSRLIGASACTDKSAPGALVTLPLLRPQLNAVKRPWYVYEFMPEEAFPVATKEPGGATRWSF